MSGVLTNFLRERRFAAAQPYLSGDVLDLGCGFGEIIDILEPEQGYVGVEGHPKIYARLMEQFPDRVFSYCDFEHDRLSLDRRFDTILMLAVIEHLRNPENILCQLPAYLNSRGRLILTTPSPIGNIIHKTGSKIGIFSKFAANDHHTIFTRASLEPILGKCGFEIIVYRRLLMAGNQLFVCTPQKFTDEKNFPGRNVTEGQ